MAREQSEHVPIGTSRGFPLRACLLRHCESRRHRVLPPNPALNNSIIPTTVSPDPRIIPPCRQAPPTRHYLFYASNQSHRATLVYAQGKRKRERERAFNPSVKYTAFGSVLIPRLSLRFAVDVSRPTRVTTVIYNNRVDKVVRTTKNEAKFLFIVRKENLEIEHFSRTMSTRWG